MDIKQNWIATWEQHTTLAGRVAGSSYAGDDRAELKGQDYSVWYGPSQELVNLAIHQLATAGRGAPGQFARRQARHVLETLDTYTDLVPEGNRRGRGLL